MSQVSAHTALRKTESYYIVDTVISYCFACVDIYRIVFLFICVWDCMVNIFIEKSLEVKLPTTWADGTKGGGKSQEKKRRKKIREEKESEEKNKGA